MRTRSARSSWPTTWRLSWSGRICVRAPSRSTLIRSLPWRQWKTLQVVGDDFFGRETESLQSFTCGELWMLWMLWMLWVLCFIELDETISVSLRNRIISLALHKGKCCKCVFYFLTGFRHVFLDFIPSYVTSCWSQKGFVERCREGIDGAECHRGAREVPERETSAKECDFPRPEDGRI